MTNTMSCDQLLSIAVYCRWVCMETHLSVVGIWVHFESTSSNDCDDVSQHSKRGKGQGPLLNAPWWINPQTEDCKILHAETKDFALCRQYGCIFRRFRVIVKFLWYLIVWTIMSRLYISASWQSVVGYFCIFFLLLQFTVYFVCNPADWLPYQ